MTHKEVYEKLLSLTISFIAYKPRSKREVSEKIDKLLTKSQKWYPYLFSEIAFVDELKESILHTLNDMNLLNDLEYAKTFVFQKLNGKKSVSRLELKSFLYKKGISKNNIDKALSVYTSDIEEKNIKKELIIRSDRDRKKLIKYLLNRGFTSSLVFKLTNLEDSA